jgi:hypothetical protein
MPGLRERNKKEDKIMKKRVNNTEEIKEKKTKVFFEKFCLVIKDSLKKMLMSVKKITKMPFG